MDNKIEVFKNEQFGSVRTTLINDEPWFVGKDVTDILGYTNSRDALAKRVDDEDKKDGVAICDSIGRTQYPIFINESGLYSLILSSKLPSAKAFKRWITHEVIPTIRKTGGYMTDSLLAQIQNNPAVIYEFANALITERSRSKMLEQQLTIAKPKADYYDAFINPDDCTNIRTTAKELKIPERKFVQFLLKERFLFRSPSGQLLPYNKKSNEGLFIVRDFVTYAFTGSQTYFTPKGKDVIRLLYAEKS